MPINQLLLVVSQNHRFDQVPEPINGRRTLSLWSQIYSKTLLVFTLEPSGLGAVGVDNKSDVCLMPSFLYCICENKCRLEQDSSWRHDALVENVDIHKVKWVTLM